MKKFLFLFLTLVFILGFGSASFAATIGQTLTTIEDGWQRFDNSDSHIQWSVAPTLDNSTGYNSYNNTLAFSNDSTAKITFMFYGTKIRILAQAFTNRSPQHSVVIDNTISETYSEKIESGYIPQYLAYEKTGLPFGIHTVQITNGGTGYITLDAIEIDSNGNLTLIPNPPILNLATAGNNTVDLSWTTVPGATSYNIKRATTANGTYATIASNVTNTTYQDTSVTNGVTYYYVVTASNSYGESANSNYLSARPVLNKAILRIEMANGSDKEYDMSASEISSFITWYDAKADGGSGKAYYIINKTSHVKPFKTRKEYISFAKIVSFEVNEYEDEN